MFRLQHSYFFSGALNKPSIVKSSESSRLLEGSSSNQELKGLSSTESSRLLEGSSSNQELKGLSSIDSNNWQQDGSSSNSQDSKRDHPFARSQLGTVKKASGVGSKPIGGKDHCYLTFLMYYIFLYYSP